MIELTVITVTYNSKSLIEDYIVSLSKNLPKSSEVIIVDSGSTDETAERVKELITKHNLKNFHQINKDENIGFGKAGNIASREAKGEYLFFLNPDTKVKPGSIEQLLNFIKADDQVGIAAPRLIEPNGQIQKSVRRLPTVTGAVADYFFGVNNAYREYFPVTETPVEVESVVGAAILIRKDLFIKLGGFDNKYFMYFEDIDLCRKVRRENLKIVYLPQAEVIHQVGGSFSEKKNEWLNESSIKYHGALKALLLYIILRVYNFLHK